ncbi:hypothetical protein BHE74_00004973, partial [Ensete ventricosum]
GGATMSSGSLSKVAVIGSGTVCASILAAGGVSVTVFETGRGAGGRMSQRRWNLLRVCGWCRETTEDGRVLFFDHGAPYFSVSDKEVMGVVRSWEARGLVSQWQVPFGSFDQSTGKFVDFEKSFIFSECWVLHSTAEYAQGVIARTGLKKLSSDALSKVAEELLPFNFELRGSAFPAIAIGGDEKCLWDKNKRLAICGDFCASPDVEGAVLSGIRAASKIMEKSSNL